MSVNEAFKCIRFRSLNCVKGRIFFFILVRCFVQSCLHGLLIRRNNHMIEVWLLFQPFNTSLPARTVPMGKICVILLLFTLTSCLSNNEAMHQKMFSLSSLSDKKWVRSMGEKVTSLGINHLADWHWRSPQKRDRGDLFLDAASYQTFSWKKMASPCRTSTNAEWITRELAFQVLRGDYRGTVRKRGFSLKPSFVRSGQKARHFSLHLQNF